MPGPSLTEWRPSCNSNRLSVKKYSSLLALLSTWFALKYFKFLDDTTNLDIAVTTAADVLPAVTVDSLADAKKVILSSGTINQSPVAASAYISGATKLKKMIEETAGLIVCPGVYDGLSARIALRVGFSALYMVRP